MRKIKIGSLVKIKKPHLLESSRGIVIGSAKKIPHVGEVLEIMDDMGKIYAVPREYIFLINFK